MSTSDDQTPTYAGVGTAELREGVAETSDGDPYVIHGVAIGAGDITRTDDGDKKLWTAEALQDAAKTLEGRPLVRHHENTAEGRIGTVTKTDFVPDVGVVYEAEIAPHYEDLAKDVEAGIQEVSVRALHRDSDLLDRDEDTGALRIDETVFDNLSIVHKGEAPSNTAEPGPSPTLSPGEDIADAARAPATASETESPGEVATLSRSVEFPDGEAVAELLQTTAETDVANDDQTASPDEADSSSADEATEVDDEVSDEDADGSATDEDGQLQEDEADVEEAEAEEVEGDSTEPDEADETEAQEMDDEAEVAELKSVAGVSFTGTSSGKLDESAIPNDDYESHYLFPADTKSDSSYPVVDADGDLRRGNVESAYELGARGGVSEDELHSKLRSLNDEFDDPPIDFEASEEAETTPEASDATSDEDDGASSQSRQIEFAQLSDSSSTHYATMTDIDYTEASEDAIEDLDDPVVVEKSEVEALGEKAERADELDERLDELNSSLEELSEDRELLADVDREKVEELAESDDPVVIESEELEAQKELVDETGEIYAEELEQYGPFDAEELMDRYTPAELREKIDDHEEAELSATIDEEPEPEGETVESEELSETAEEAEREELEEDAREMVADELESIGWDRQAEKVRSGEMDLEELGVEIE